MWHIVLILIVLIIVFRPKYKSPEVIRGVITDEECEYIKSMAKEKLKPSTIGDEFVEDEEIRKSETAWLDPDDHHIQSIIAKCVDDVTLCENLQVVRYTPGGFFKPHQDADIEHSNRRKHTFIFALNDEYEGGETYFPILDKTYRLRKGDVLSFDTLDSWGSSSIQSDARGCTGHAR
jgi:prolyl 4-hydroxylase